jgi:tRNA A-37 threonylcarbamoyl transferase component Bud32
MTTGGNGDDGRKPSGSHPATPRAPAVTPSKVVRTGEHAEGNTKMGAADTAVAIGLAHSQTDRMKPLKAEDLSDHGHTEPEIRAQNPDDEDLLVGTTLLGRYAITKKIGQGGMGAVYEASHTLIGKRVAVKVLLDKYAKKDQIVARLEQEARLASSIGHEHIIDITDFGTTADGRTFVVMEFLEGESLAECLSREGTLPESRILLIAQQVASALGAAHAKGVVHRDVKPENVFLLRRKDKDFAKVVDFGISKNLRSTGEGGADSPRLTQTGMVLGTPLYMSPEQARGDDNLDHRIDIYALGVIMYELATGRVPFSGTNYLSVISQVLNDEPMRPRQIKPELTEEFEAVVLRALEKEKERRYQSTDEMLADINMLLEDPMRSTQRPRILAPVRKRMSRGGDLRVLAWIVGVAVVIAAVAFTVSKLMPAADDKKGAAAALPDARIGAVVPPLDAGGIAAPDAAVVKKVELWVQSSPGKAQIFDAKGKYLGNAPMVVEVAEGAPAQFRAGLDGYPDVTFELDAAKHARHMAQKTPYLVKLKKKPGGGGGPDRKIDAGVKDPTPTGPCPGDLKRLKNGKCPGE